ncbi:hypothetical protein GCM10009038_05610 [Salinicola rhizosphaerae]|uniref:Uncharacterized protein n=1 Tax=Salinicola rhizosphaerae TaxID=1443141 RepID=A0ABQ3DPJ0_9GAMM|nr:hypothetical protein GCM10009038_05610 [Salinicola rhizosphaerae]
MGHLLFGEGKVADGTRREIAIERFATSNNPRANRHIFIRFQWLGASLDDSIRPNGPITLGSLRKNDAGHASFARFQCATVIPPDRRSGVIK